MKKLLVLISIISIMPLQGMEFKSNDTEKCSENIIISTRQNDIIAECLNLLNLSELIFNLPLDIKEAIVPYLNSNYFYGHPAFQMTTGYSYKLNHKFVNAKKKGLSTFASYFYLLVRYCNTAIQKKVEIEAELVLPPEEIQAIATIFPHATSDKPPLNFDNITNFNNLTFAQNTELNDLIIQKRLSIYDGDRYDNQEINKILLFSGIYLCFFSLFKNNSIFINLPNIFNGANYALPTIHFKQDMQLKLYDYFKTLYDEKSNPFEITEHLISPNFVKRNHEQIRITITPDEQQQKKNCAKNFYLLPTMTAAYLAKKHTINLEMIKGDSNYNKQYSRLHPKIRSFFENLL